jgi:hypothetical protein
MTTSRLLGTLIALIGALALATDCASTTQEPTIVARIG